MTPLSSSNLAGFDYDAETETLTITFVSGRTYSYSSVPQSVVDGLESASSPGRYFNSAIKDTYNEKKGYKHLTTKDVQKAVRKGKY